MNNSSIVFVINVVHTMSGASKVMLSVANESVKHFKNVYVVGMFNETDTDCGDENIKFIPLKISSDNKGLWRLFCIKKLRSCFKEIKPDIICTFVSHACTMSRIASLGLKTVVVSCERGDPYTTSKNWQKILRWTYNKSDYCVFQLPSARDFFSEKVKKNSVVIPNPFIPKAQPLERWNQSSKTIVSAGRLFDRQKDFTTLIKAFAIVHHTHPDYSLLIYGEGDSRPDYECLINHLGLKNCVSLPGFVKNVSEEIKDKGVFVLSSVFEGIPNTLLEALSMGLPCVATDCSPGGAKYLTDNGHYGKLIDIGDVESMANEIIYFIENPCEAERIGKLGKGSISRFETSTILKEWITFFNKVLCQH